MDSEPIQIPEDLVCGCNEPMKLNRNRRLPPIGCPVCNSEVCIDSPAAFAEVAKMLRRYWLAHGRRDYAGLEDS